MLVKRENIIIITLKFLVFILLIGVTSLMTSCRNKNNKEPIDDSVNNNFINSNDDEDNDNDCTDPTIIVQGSKAKAGDKKIEVVIKIKNNPGILGMDFDLYYDDTVMVLTNSQSLLDLTGCSFTSPAYYRNPTTFLWDFQDLNWTEDGEFLKLEFDITKNISPGEYDIKLMYSYGNIFDGNGEPLDIEVKNGHIIIESDSEKLGTEINISTNDKLMVLGTIFSSLTNGDLSYYRNTIVSFGNSEIIAEDSVDNSTQSISYLPGDADENERINTLDITSIRRYISDGRKTDPNGYNVVINENAADVDANGRINTLDITMIRRYISDGRKTDPNGYNIVLKPGQMSCNHNLKGTAAKEPTCSESGNIAYWYCDKCNKYFIDANAEYETTLANTVLEINSLNHTYDTKWSCDETAHWYAATCEHSTETKSYAAHNWDNGVVISEATVYDEGEKLYICQDCGYEKEETIATIPSFTVIFYDNDNKIISQKNYELNTLSSNIIIPKIQVSGYTFAYWVTIDDSKKIEDIDFTTSSQNDVYSFKPKLTKVHKVVFNDYNGEKIGETILIKDGEKLLLSDLPVIPEREGYTSKWDEQILTTNITENKVYTPVYEIITFNVTFLDAKNGNKIKSEQVEYGSFMIIPEYDEYRLTNKLYKFTGWKSAVTDTFIDNVEGNKIVKIYSDLTLYAVYEDNIEQPVIAMHIGETVDGSTTVTVSLCMPDNTTLYSINMSISWMVDNERICKINLAKIADPSWLESDYCSKDNIIHIAKDDWFTYNNKSKTLDFVWSCGIGHTFLVDKNTITINFGTQNVEKFDEEVIFTILENSSIVYGESSTSDNTLKKSNIIIWFY